MSLPMKSGSRVILHSSFFVAGDVLKAVSPSFPSLPHHIMPNNDVLWRYFTNGQCAEIGA